MFTRVKVPVFVDGCFWHACNEHRTVPSANEAWWAAKLAKNVEREVDRRFPPAGWLVVTVREHEDSAAASSRVADAVRGR